MCICVFVDECVLLSLMTITLPSDCSNIATNWFHPWVLTVAHNILPSITITTAPQLLAHMFKHRSTTLYNWCVA